MEERTSGLTVLRTKFGAVNVMVDERNGWLIPPFDSKAIQEKMVQILNSEEKIIEEKKSNSVKKIKQQFLWDAVVSQEINAIKKAIGK